MLQQSAESHSQAPTECYRNEANANIVYIGEGRSTKCLGLRWPWI